MRTEMIKLDLPQRFNKGEEYEFINADNLKFNLEFVDYSRIDGYPIFKLDLTKIPIGTIIADSKHLNIKPKSAQLMKILEDQSHLYSTGNYFSKNKDILMDFFFDMYDIDPEKLTTPEGMKELVRDIKIINVLD